MRVDELDTPCLTVDLDVFETNVRLCIEPSRRRSRAAAFEDREEPRRWHGCFWTREPVGICVAKLSEAEVMLAEGLDDVLITTELAGPIKARRLAQLITRWPDARVRVVVDSWEGASVIDAALPRALETLIDVNVGQDRCGVAPEDVLALAERLGGLDRLRLVGITGIRGQPPARTRPEPSGSGCATARCERLAAAVDGSARRRTHGRRRDHRRQRHSRVLRTALRW